jgi:hypothetical protein
MMTEKMESAMPICQVVLAINTTSLKHFLNGYNILFSLSVQPGGGRLVQ